MAESAEFVVAPDGAGCVYAPDKQRTTRYAAELLDVAVGLLGSFSASINGARAGNLVLDRDLVRASPYLIDYVVTHESSRPDHGSEWQNLLIKTMPDWRERKRVLERQLL
jgi:hypothetical protein